MTAMGWLGPRRYSLAFSVRRTAQGGGSIGESASGPGTAAGSGVKGIGWPCGGSWIVGAAGTFDVFMAASSHIPDEL